MKRIIKALIVFLDKIYKRLYNEHSLGGGIIRHALPKMDNYWSIVDIKDDLNSFTKRHWASALKELFDILNIEYYSRVQVIMQTKKYDDISSLWYATDILNSMSEILFDKLNGND